MFSSSWNLFDFVTGISGALPSPNALVSRGTPSCVSSSRVSCVGSFRVGCGDSASRLSDGMTRGEAW